MPEIIGDAHREAMRHRRGQIIGVYPRKPNVRCGMANTVFVHVENIPDAVTRTKIYWTLTQDRDYTTDELGDKRGTSMSAYKMRTAKVPDRLWELLDIERRTILTWDRFKKCIASWRHDNDIADNDFTTGPTD